MEGGKKENMSVLREEREKKQKMINDDSSN